MPNNTKKVTRNRRPRRRKGAGAANGNRAAVERYAGDAYSLAARTARGLNQIRKYINIEEKYFDVTSVTAPSQAGAVTTLTYVAQGVTVNDRIGDSIKVQRLMVNYRIILNASATSSGARILICRDMENSGTQATGANVMTQTGAGTAAHSFRTWANRKRFSILSDEYFALDTTNLSASFSYDVPLEKHVMFRTSGVDAASQGEGSIFILALTNEATNVPAIAGQSRIIFTDD